jgi:hypothetical protein
MTINSPSLDTNFEPTKTLNLPISLLIKKMGTSPTRSGPHNVAEREQKDNSFTSTIWRERESKTVEKEPEAVAAESVSES